MHKIAAAALDSLLLSACAPEGPDRGSAPAPGAHTWIAANGVAILYEVPGQGEPTVLLAHCWMGDRTFWSRQVPALSETSRVV